MNRQEFLTAINSLCKIGLKYDEPVFSFLNQLTEQEVAQTLTTLNMLLSITTPPFLASRDVNGGGEAGLQRYVVNKIFLALHVQHPDYNMPSTIGFLKYNSNSCYLDTTLMALIGMPIKEVSEGILNKTPPIEPLQSALKDVANRLRNRERIGCENVRVALSHSKSPEPFHHFGAHDVGEFLQHLFNSFKFDIAHQRTVTTLISSDGKRKQIKNQTVLTSPIINVQLYASNIGDVRLSEMTSNEDITEFDKPYLFERELYVKKIDTVSYTSDFMVFHMNRLYINGGTVQRDYTKIIPEQKITDGRGVILKLYAIIVHCAGHYTCYLKDMGAWFYYDDMASEMRIVGTYDEMLSAAPSLCQFGTLYFYR